MTSTDVNLPPPRTPQARGANAGGIFRYLAVVGVAFLALMMMLETDVGFVAPPAARLVFWVLQIASGLITLQAALYLLTRRLGASRLPSWFLVLLSGVLGAVVLAPIYWLIGEGLMQGWLGYPARPDEDGDDPLGVMSDIPMLKEYLEIVGPVTAAWALICMSRLHWLVPPLLRAQVDSLVQEPRRAPATSQEGERSAVSTSQPAPPVPRQPAAAKDADDALTVASDGLGPPGAAAIASPPRGSWRERLPLELGSDVIAVASELQYLRVWTPRGCALILGALADVESEGADSGLRVHRSWWVCREHVVSVRRTATGTVCVMSDGRKVPVSRRRSAEVLARFGDGAQFRVERRSETVAHTNLN